MLGVHRFGLTRSSGLASERLTTWRRRWRVVFAPLLGVIAFAIKLDSRGPVLFRQERIGRDDRRFRMLKFRTMVDGADAQRRSCCTGTSATASSRSPTTRASRGSAACSARSYLDELPQLLNVLRGDMSLVGPRPLVMEDDSRIEGWDRRRLHLTPGMTGPWQVTGGPARPSPRWSSSTISMLLPGRSGVMSRSSFAPSPWCSTGAASEPMNGNNAEQGGDLRALLAMLRRRAAVIVLATVVGVVGALVFSYSQEKSYEATASLLFRPSSSTSR